MKLIAKLALPLTLALSLSGCSALSIFDGPVSTIGIDGTDLTDVTRNDAMNIDNRIMMLGCIVLKTYDSGERPNFDGSTDKYTKGEGRDLIRQTATDLFGTMEDEYAEIRIYSEGILDELADPGSNPEGLVKFRKFCRTYDAVLLKIQKNFVEPLEVSSTCWSSVNISATLEEEIDGEWVEFKSKTDFASSDACTGNDYPYAVTFSVDRSKLDSGRTIRMVLTSTSGTFNDGSYTLTEDPQTFYESTSSLTF